MKSLFKRITSTLLAVSMMLSLGISMPKEINRTAEAATQNVANGMYYIKNSYSEMYLEASGLARTKAQEGTDASLRQIWKITHVTGGYYSIRPLSNLETCLTVNYPSVSVGECSTADTSSALDIEEMWWFDGDADDCKIKPYFSSFRTYPIGLSGSHDGANLMFNASSSFDYWELEAVSNRSGIYIKGIETNNASTGIMWASLNVSKAVEAYVYSPTSNETSLTWTSSNTSIVTIDSGGVMTPHAVGTATIVATSTVNPSIKKTITLNVSEFIDGTYYIRSVFDEKCISGAVQLREPAEYHYHSSSFLPGILSLMWKFTITTDGQYTIKNVNSNLYLTYDNSSGKIILDTLKNTQNQKWIINQLSDGNFSLNMNVNSYEEKSLVFRDNFLYLDTFSESNINYKWEILKTSFSVMNYVDSDFSIDKQEYILPLFNLLNQVYQESINEVIKFDIMDIQVDNVTGAEDCLNTGSCDNSCNIDCSKHHKNVYRIYEELLDSDRIFNQINILWSDDAIGVYCKETNTQNHILYNNNSYFVEMNPAIILSVNNNCLDYSAQVFIEMLAKIPYLLGFDDTSLPYIEHTSHCAMDSDNTLNSSEFYYLISMYPNNAYCGYCCYLLNDVFGKTFEGN